MKTFQHFRVFWLAAFALLTFGQVLHFIEHLDMFPEVSHAHHGDDHSHHSAPEPTDSTNHTQLAGHCHSPAIVDDHSFQGELASTLQTFFPTPSLPESPVREIDYPPQLS